MRPSRIRVLLMDDIDKLKPLRNDNVSQAIVTIIKNQGIDLHGMDGITSLLELERKICELVMNYKGSSEERQIIFHLIQIWGGRAGRSIYVRPQQRFNWNDVDMYYKPFIDSCRSIKGTSISDMQSTLSAAVDLNGLKYIGYTFITKHLRFWTYPQLKLQMFPPYDSKMSRCYMNRRYNYKDIIPYWQRIYREAAQKRMSVAEYERNLFNGF